MKKPIVHIPTATATYEKSPCTHSGTTTLQMKTSTFIVPALSNPAPKNNLLTVQSLASKYGPVLFAKQSEIAIDALRGNPKVLAEGHWSQHHQAYVLITKQPTIAAARINNLDAPISRKRKPRTAPP